MTKRQWIQAMASREWDAYAAEIWGTESSISIKQRMNYLFGFCDDATEVRLFSTPGRTELAGNHTDHNHGRVLAGSVHLDALAAIRPRSDARVVLESAGYRGAFQVDLSDLAPHPDEAGKLEGLIRGVAAGFSRRGLEYGGFEGRIHSLVPAGSGLSSSAAIEVLLGTVLSGLYNGGSVPGIELAKIGQSAENSYFYKPCGLMDQTACALGGITAVDFALPDKPRMHSMDFSFNDHGYILSVVNTGGSHADLTEDYASCPREMFAVAKALSHESAADIRPEELITAIPDIRASCGDRAILRILHFMNESRRVLEMTQAVKTGDIEAYIAGMRASGDSSWRLLQNCYAPENPWEQGIPLAIELAERAVKRNSAFRVHGGGFAGTIQALVHKDEWGNFLNRMEEVFGKGAVIPLRIRSQGSIEVIPAA